MENKLLEIKNLHTSFRIRDDYYAAVDDVSLTVNKNEVLAVVGESGSGKSAFAFSIMRLHNRAKTEGEILFKGEDVIQMSDSRLNQVRGLDMAMIFQDPLTALNPLMTVEEQIGEALHLHDRRLSKTQVRQHVLDLLDQVGIPHPKYAIEQYPHELSGGMRQRVMIAIAISNDPEILIADEPTTALDVTIQAQILDLIRDLKEKMDAGIILITQDLGVVAEMADRVAVMYAGEIVEVADVGTLFDQPKHPYTRSLLHSVPNTAQKEDKLHVIQGVVPPLAELPRTGCRFKGRIPWMDDSVHEENPTLHEINPGHFVRCTCYQQFHFPNKEEVELSGLS